MLMTNYNSKIINLNILNFRSYLILNENHLKKGCLRDEGFLFKRLKR